VVADDGDGDARHRTERSRRSGVPAGTLQQHDSGVTVPPVDNGSRPDERFHAHLGRAPDEPGRSVVESGETERQQRRADRSDDHAHDVVVDDGEQGTANGERTGGQHLEGCRSALTHDHNRPHRHGERRHE